MTSALLPRPEVAAPRAWSFPAADRFVLPNGLAVVAQHLPGKHVAAVRLLLDLPLHAEPVGQEGIASIAIAALDEGTQAYDAQGFAAARNRLGASYSASCDASGGTVALEVPVSRFGPALDLLAEAVLRPTFPAAEVERLVKQRLDAIASERATPGGRAGIELAARYYAQGSRRALPSGGTAESVSSLDRDLVAAFFAGQVDPATSTLVVAGDLTGIDLQTLVSTCFGDWSTQGRTRTTPATDDVVAGPQVVIVDRPGSVQTMLALALPGVDRTHPDMPGLQVAARVLGGGMESRIMAVLREEKGYTYGISARVDPGRSDGRIVISGAVQTEVTGPAVTDLVAILREFAATGVREDELAPAVEALAGRAPLSYERPQGVAQAAALVAAEGLPADYVDVSLAALRQTSVASVNEAFVRSAPLDRLVLVAVGDAAEILESLQAAGLGEVTVVSA